MEMIWFNDATQHLGCVTLRNTDVIYLKNMCEV